MTGSLKRAVITNLDSKYSYRDKTRNTISDTVDQRRVGGSSRTPSLSYTFLSEAACYWLVNQHPYSPAYSLHFDQVACRLTRTTTCRSFFLLFLICFFSAKFICLEFKTLFSQMGNGEVSKLQACFIHCWYLSCQLDLYRGWSVSSNSSLEILRALMFFIHQFCFGKGVENLSLLAEFCGMQQLYLA